MDKIKAKAYKILRWSEQYTKTDMVYLAHGGFWLTLGQAVSSASSFLLAIAFANLLPKEIYGNYKYILSIAGILSIPTLSGMNTAVVQAVARGYEGSIIPALKTKIQWGVVGALISLVLALYYFIIGNNTLTISFLVVSFFTPFMDSFSIYDSLLQGRKLFSTSTKYNIISQIIAVIISTTTIFLTDNLFIIILAYFIPWTTLRFIFLKKTLNKFQSNNQTDPQTISYGKNLSLMNIMNALATQIDKILLFHYLGPIEVATYTIALAIPEQIKGWIKNINILALPKFSQRPSDEIKNTILGKILKMSLILIIISGLYIILAPFIFKEFFPQYLESVRFSKIFALSLPAIVSGIPYSILQAKIKTRWLYFYNYWNSFIQIILMVILIHFFGIIGAILARVFTRFMGLTILIWSIRKI